MEVQNASKFPNLGRHVHTLLWLFQLTTHWVKPWLHRGPHHGSGLYSSGLQCLTNWLEERQGQIELNINPLSPTSWVSLGYHIKEKLSTLRGLKVHLATPSSVWNKFENHQELILDFGKWHEDNGILKKTGISWKDCLAVLKLFSIAISLPWVFFSSS